MTIKEKKREREKGASCTEERMRRRDGRREQEKGTDVRDGKKGGGSDGG